jgi:hypothetical protein
MSKCFSNDVTKMMNEFDMSERVNIDRLWDFNWDEIEISNYRRVYWTTRIEKEQSKLTYILLKS